MNKKVLVSIVMALIFAGLLYLYMHAIDDPIGNFLKAYDIHLPHLPDSIINLK
jgi:hypothetical protein